MASASKNARLCSRCKDVKAKVRDIRDESGIIRRMRICPSCGRKWTTVEVFEWEYDQLKDIAARAKRRSKTEKSP